MTRLRRMLHIALCSWPETWERKVMPFEKSIVLWFGGKIRHHTLTSAGPKAFGLNIHLIRCFITP